MLKSLSTLRLQSQTKSLNCKDTAKISNEFYQRGLIITNFLRIFGTPGIKTPKKLANSSKCQSISITTGILIFGNQLM